MIINNSSYPDDSTQVLSILENMEYLDEGESCYPASAVPVQCNTRLNKNLIHLENFMDFADHNGIDDAGIAISAICQENNISPDSIGFVIQESTIFAEDEYLDVVGLLQENSYEVLISPESTESIYYKELEEALELDSSYDTFEESVNLLAFCEEGIIDRVQGNAAKLKDAVTASPKKLAKKLSAIKTSIGEKTAQLKNATGSAKSFLQNQISKLKSAFNTVGSKLSAAKNAVVDNATAAKDWVVDKATGAKNAVTGFFSSKKKAST